MSRPVSVMHMGGLSIASLCLFLVFSTRVAKTHNENTVKAIVVIASTNSGVGLFIPSPVMYLIVPERCAHSGEACGRQSRGNYACDYHLLPFVVK